MSFMLWELAKHKDVQTRLRDEIKSARSANNGTPFAAHNLDEIPYLQAVIKVRANRGFVHLGTNRPPYRSSSVSTPLCITLSGGLEKMTFCRSMSPFGPSQEP